MLCADRPRNRIIAIADSASVLPNDSALSAPRPSPHLARWGIDAPDDDGVVAARATIRGFTVFVAALHAEAKPVDRRGWLWRGPESAVWYTRTPGIGLFGPREAHAFTRCPELAASTEGDPLMGQPVRHFAAWGGIASIVPDANRARLLDLARDEWARPRDSRTD
jgi:hypothetical protein